MNDADERQDARNMMVRNLTTGLRQRLVLGDTLDEAVARMEAASRSECTPWPDMLVLRLDALAEAHVAIRKDLDKVVYLRKAAIRSGRPDWYAGPGDEAIAWRRLRERLSTIGRAQKEIDIVDEDSTAVLSLIDNPSADLFSTRGLVIGHVQSGKTGNIAAVIAKAADTPFKFFLVLSGMTDTLRNQTQERLDADILGDAGERWHSWTKVDRVEVGVAEKGDFNHPPVGGFQFDGSRRHLAVVKKNAGILRRILRKLQATPEATLKQTPVLIIDDECDQASVNSAALNRAFSTINRLIREIVQLLPRVSYVGYTATPFANVLINPAEAKDLYPRHFIHPLRRPAAYFGAAELFGREALDGEMVDVETGYDMIREVPDAEIPLLRPAARERDAFVFTVTPSLGRAIRYFVMAIAARTVRGQSGEHSSMLVHTSVLNTVHRSAESAIRPYLSGLAVALRNADPTILREFADQWGEECARIDALDFDLTALDFGDIEDVLADAAGSIEVKVENWSSVDRIDYTLPGRKYLVIGGNVLARGLTLHGLMVSFFMRSSSQYDTLMQMGRWFGYRPGFGDLPRVWMETAVREAFFELATVEEEVRRDAMRYAEEGFTPEQFAVRIRTIPGMAVTARTKMRDAVTANIGYDGQHLQTIRFRRQDAEWLDSNWRAAAHLVDAGKAAEAVRGNIVIRGIGIDAIRRFLGEYESEANKTMERRLLLGYLAETEEKNSSLAVWNVVVIGTEGGAEAQNTLGTLGRVRCVNRSPLENSGDVASIKALMSKQDLLADMDAAVVREHGSNWGSIKNARESRRQPPLLLLYPIAKDSMPAHIRSKARREPMAAVADLMGLGIYFPGSKDEARRYVRAALQPEDAVESYDGENALPEEILDGGTDAG